MENRIKVIISAVLLLLAVFSIGSSHATSNYLYSSQNNVTVNQSNTLVASSIQMFSNSTLQVTVSTNSSNILFSTSSFKLTPTTGYNFNFYVNASTTSKYFLTFVANNSASYSVPVYVKSVQQNSTPSNGYKIDLFGNVQSNSQVVVYVTKNGSTITDGNLFVQYNNISEQYSLSTINSFAKIDFPTLYGNVILEYVSPSGQLVGPQIIPVANASKLPNAQTQILTAYCNGKETNIQGNNNTIIATYSISPFTNITCSLYNQNTASYVSGVSVQVIENGVISRPYQTNLLGEVVIPYPTGGWTTGMMALRPASTQYDLGSAYFNVVPIQNPLTYSISGDLLTINPVIPQNVKITYPNGSVLNSDRNSTFTISSVGNVDVVASNSSYSTFSQEIYLKQIDLKLVTIDSGKVQTIGDIYPYITYTFELMQNGTLSTYTGNLIIGGKVFQFSNGVAHGYLQSYNMSFIPSSNQYYVSTDLTALPTSFYLSLPPTLSEGHIYTFSMVAQNSTQNNSDPSLHYTGNIYFTQDNKTVSVPISNGVGTVSFASTKPFTISFNGTTALILASQIGYVKNTSGGDITYIGVGIGIVILVVVAILLSKRKTPETVFIGE